MGRLKGLIQTDRQTREFDSVIVYTGRLSS